ncbi:MAG: DUF6314 family protein [Brevirhabdus sp.]
MPSFQDFEGRWHLWRRIDHAAAGATGVFEGMASLHRNGQQMVYEEAGELRLEQGPGMKATRRYLWRVGEGGLIEVFFEDGRDFHRFDPQAGVVSAWHDCPPDLYEVSYNFARWPDWQATWRVKGPRKDYTMITDYRR